MSLANDIRNAMRTGGALNIIIDRKVNDSDMGRLIVYLHRINANLIEINLTATGGEAEEILWLPWKQGEVTQLTRGFIQNAPPGTLFFTFELTGCKVFAIEGGPVWHIDAPIKVEVFWPIITASRWVKENWPALETKKNTIYFHRAGQPTKEWDLSGYLDGGATYTYGAENVGNAIVGGIVNDKRNIDIYYRTSPWAGTKYASTKRLK